MDGGRLQDKMHRRGKQIGPAEGWSGGYYVFFANFSRQRGQVMAILPLPLGTRTS